MDVLKKQLNDIGSCIGYPFYFFEDGSFSSTFVCGKMNACLVVKGAFAESDKCFFASAEIAKFSEVKALEKGWTQKSVVPNTVNWFKKYLNDIGTTLNYPFYVFDDGAYDKTSSLDGKQAVLYVKKPFTSVEGESSFFAPDAQKVLQFNKDLKKLKQRRETQKTELQQIIFQMLACRRISDEQMLRVIDAGRLDLLVDYLKKVDCNSIYFTYPKSLRVLVKADNSEVWSMFHWPTLCGCPDTMIEYAFRMGGLKILKFFLENVCPYKEGEGYPQYLIERGDVALYQYYRSYVASNWKHVGYFDSEFSAILKFKTANMLAVLLKYWDLKPEDQGKLVEYGNVEMIHTYIRKKGLNERFRQLLLYSGRDELVELANNPQKVLRENSQKKVVTVAQGETETGEFSGWLQKVKKFFGISA